MAGNFYLDWAIMAVSLINVILMLWLGVTVLLNAERRSWGVWLAGTGLLLGGAFFISHSAILGFGLDYFGQGLNVWWRIGWIPVVALPFVWYMVMLWYAGFWNDEQLTYLPNRQAGWVLVTFGLLVGLVGWLIVASPLPTFTQLIQFELSTVPTVAGAPIFLLIYPLYIILCTGLALNVLRHPGPSARMMADQARQRARPWLMLTSVAQLVVSLLVAGIIAWVLIYARQVPFLDQVRSLSTAVGWFDLIIATLIAAAVISVGQAVVSYEVFTGKALPRRELQRYWRNAIILAVGYGIVVGWSFSLQVQPIYSLLLTTVLMTLFYALLSWRSFTWRERYIRHLRPFVASQNLYEQLLSPSLPAPHSTLLEPDVVNVSGPFRALCREVLDSRLAYLIAIGPLAPLVPPLTYPEDIKPSLSILSEIAATFRSPQTICVPINPDQTDGALWAVPLWSERGLIGVFLLGPKRDGGLYTQEEIEIARASGERLIDTRASTEIARRLMALQRQRLAESQILDQQTRRVLHDDVLPDLHATLLRLSGEAVRHNGLIPDTIAVLTDVHGRISDLLHELPKTTEPLLARFGFIGAIKQIVADELAGMFDTVIWQVDPEAKQVIRTLPPLSTEVLFYATREIMRNAARHGLSDSSEQPLNLVITLNVQDGLVIRIEDDGVGIEAGPASSSGSGQGLALHSTMLAIIGGLLNVESVPKSYTRVTITLAQQSMNALEKSATRP